MDGVSEQVPPGRGHPPMATCPECSAPLICTLAFSRFEFYCLECGHQCGWLDPVPVPWTPAVEERQHALQAEWDEHAGKSLIGGGAMLQSCETCMSVHEEHWVHATEEERAAHKAALDWLANRRRDHAEVIGG